METTDIWEKIIIPLVIGPIFIFIKVLYDRWDTKQTQKKLLINKIRLEKISNQLDKFYWPLYIRLLDDYNLWSKINFKDNIIEITESGSESELDNNDNFITCNYIKKEGDTVIKCKNPVAENCIDNYGAYCIKHKQYKSEKIINTWHMAFEKTKLITEKNTNIVDYDKIINSSQITIDIEPKFEYDNSNFNDKIQICNEDTLSNISNRDINDLIDKLSIDNSDKNEINSKMLNEILKYIIENHQNILKIIVDNIYIAEPKKNMTKQLMKFSKFINIFRSEINSNSDLINPCNYGAGYPKKLLPMVEKKVLSLQEQYNELINSYYD